MPRVFSADDLLSHLNRCEECEYYVGAPIMCKGQIDKSKNGFWYEKCLKNAQPTPNSCTFFAWRPDITWGKPTGGKKTPCPGALCREASKPNTINVECTFGVCMRCCRHLQALLTVVRSCSIASHRNGVVYPTPETNEGSREDSTPKRRGRGRPKKAKESEKAALDEPRGEDDAEPEPVAATSSRGPPKRKIYATPTSPFYQARVSALDAEHRLEVDRHAEREKQSRAQSYSKTITLRWWRKDGAEPENAEVVVDNPSSFHPKDIPYLVDLYNCDTQVFQYYDSKKSLWYTGSRFSAPRDLNKLSAEDFSYRSEGVTWGHGMPGQSKKRPLPDDSPDNETPRRPQPPFAHFPNTPASTPRRSDSPAATEPPMSGSSAFGDDFDSDPFFNAFNFTPTTFDNGAHTYTDINDTQPRLAALFPNDADSTPALSSSSALPVPQPSELDLSTAPRGRGSKPWPWRYVCDMAAGFAAIRLLEDSQPPVDTPEAFKDVFKADYKKTTYREQLRAWRAAGLVAGERERWIQYGRTEAGEWLTFMRSWRQGR